MKYLLIFLMSLGIISCQKNEKSNVLDILRKSDKIDFYQISQQTEEEFWDGARNDKIDKTLENILLSSEPLHLRDNLICDRLDKYYSKYPVGSKTVDKISNLVANGHKQLFTASFASSATACSPIYRDILVFSKKNKIIGIAKVCFGCSQNYVIIENKEVGNINLDYSKLHEVLDEVASN